MKLQQCSVLAIGPIWIIMSTWWTLSADRTVLNLTNISAGLASWLNSIVGGYLPVYVQGYFQSRLEALNETHACIVGQIPYIEGSNASVPISPSLENKIWLFYQWGIRNGGCIWMWIGLSNGL